MSSSNSNKADRSSERGRSCSHNKGCGGKWSPMNIAAMVIGFVLFWPIGLLVLFWILSGRNVKELPGAIREKWAAFTGGSSGLGYSQSENVVFNEYQQTQFDRIREIKEEIGDRARRFRDFRANARRRADEEEFNLFMADKPVSGDK